MSELDELYEQLLHLCWCDHESGICTGACDILDRIAALKLIAEVEQKTALRTTTLEEIAIKIHDFLWTNSGKDGAVEISGDDATADELVSLLNQLQREIKDRGLATHNYAQTNSGCR